VRWALLILASTLCTPALALEPPRRGDVRLETPDVVVDHPPDLRPIADRLVALVPRAIAGVEEALGRRVPPRPQVILTPNDAEFERRLAELGGGDHPRALAVAVLTRQVILVRADRIAEGTNAGLERTLRHELAHLALATVRAHRPRWVEEGLCEWASGRRLEAAEDGALAARARLGVLPTLDEVEAALATEGPATADAYTVAAAFVAALDARRPGAPRALVAGLASGATVDGALTEATGASLALLEVEWREGLTRSSGWWWAALGLFSPWSLIGLLALAAIARHLWVRRRLRAALEAAEQRAPEVLEPHDDLPEVEG
jgi:hypothetical protein